jgi:hypothetical protein
MEDMLGHASINSCVTQRGLMCLPQCELMTVLQQRALRLHDVLFLELQIYCNSLC